MALKIGALPLGRVECDVMRTSAVLLICGLVGGLAVLPAVLPSAAEETAAASSTFTRFIDDGSGEGRFETAITRYGRGDGAEVALIAVVHVADAGYYRDLEKHFESYDALLYEMIKDKDFQPGPETRASGLLSFFQRGLKNVLGLEFQLDAIDYSKKNFVHADLDPETFFRLQRERGESIITLMFRAMMEDFKRRSTGKGPRQLGMVELIAAFASDDSARMLKYLLAQQLEDIEGLLAGIEGKDGKGSVIVTERNKAALRVLKDELAAGKKKLGIFYGAAHMPDLERRLVTELGFEKKGERWLTAWDIKRKRAAAPPPAPGGKEAPPPRRVKL
jgi:hypothetical protein